jgi:hypothetical protein
LAARCRDRSQDPFIGDRTPATRTPGVLEGAAEGSRAGQQVATETFVRSRNMPAIVPEIEPCSGPDHLRWFCDDEKTAETF